MSLQEVSIKTNQHLEPVTISPTGPYDGTPVWVARPNTTVTVSPDGLSAVISLISFAPGPHGPALGAAQLTIVKGGVSKVAKLAIYGYPGTQSPDAVPVVMNCV